MKKTFILLLALFISCNHSYKYKNVNNLSLEDFNLSKDLTGITLSFDSDVLRPTDIIVIDSLLMIVEPSEDKLIHIFNLFTKKKISQCINRGQGPDDMIMPQFMHVQDDLITIADLATSTINTFKISDLLTSNNTVTPILKIKLNEMINTDVEMLNGHVICSSYSDTYQLSVFDLEGNKIKEMIEYPASNIDYSNVELKNAFYMNFLTSPTNNRIVLFYYSTDLIEIYDEEGTLIKRFHGPDKFFAHFKEFKNNEISSSVPKKGLNRDAYFSPENAGNEFMVLYNGGYVDDPNHSVFCNTIYSFSLDGKPNAIYKLTDPIFCFSVDDKIRKIYGISDTPDYHIVEYTY